MYNRYSYKEPTVHYPAIGEASAKEMDTIHRILENNRTFPDQLKKCGMSKDENSNNNIVITPSDGDNYIELIISNILAQEINKENNMGKKKL